MKRIIYFGLVILLGGSASSHFVFDRNMGGYDANQMLDVDKFFALTGDLDHINEHVDETDTGLFDKATEVYDELFTLWEKVQRLASLAGKTGFSCPHGKLIHEHTCFWLTEAMVTHPTAAQECRQKYGHLAILDLTDDDFGKYLDGVVTVDDMPGYYWIDGDHDAGGDYILSNGYIVESDNPRYGTFEPDESGAESLVYENLEASETEGTWEISTWPSDSDKFGICQAKALFYLPGDLSDFHQLLRLIELIGQKNEMIESLLKAEENQEI